MSVNGEVSCPFCGCDPYEYVHNGIGMERVAVTCCELGAEFFAREPKDTVTISREDFEHFASVFGAMRRLGMSP